MKIKKIGYFDQKILSFGPFLPILDPFNFFLLAICERPWYYQHFGTITSKIEQELGVTMICTKIILFSDYFGIMLLILE